MIRRPPRSTLSSSSAASDVYKRQHQHELRTRGSDGLGVREDLRGIDQLDDPRGAGGQALTVQAVGVVEVAYSHPAELVDLRRGGLLGGPRGTNVGNPGRIERVQRGLDLSLIHI